MHTKHIFFNIGIIASFTPEAAVLFPGENVIFTCNLTIGRLWIVGDIGTRKANNELPDGLMAHGNMLVITQSANDTLYGCGVTAGDNFIFDTGMVYLAGTYNVAFMYVYATVQLSFKVTFAHVPDGSCMRSSLLHTLQTCLACIFRCALHVFQTCPACVPDASYTCYGRIPRLAKKGMAVTLVLLQLGFVLARMRLVHIPDASRAHPKCIFCTSQTRRARISDACKRYVGAELYRTYMSQFLVCNGALLYRLLNLSLGCLLSRFTFTSVANSSELLQ